MLIQNQTSKPFANISIIGLGYVGLPTAAILASRKLNVIGVDINPVIVEHVNSGKLHFMEPSLDILVHGASMEGYLRATSIPETSDAFLIAVPTPIDENNQPDLSHIKSACHLIAPVLKKGDLLILESTSPVGTTEAICGWLEETRFDLTFPQSYGEQSDIRVAYCPERVLPGHVVREIVQNDRVIGGITPKCSARALELYQLFVEGECIITDVRKAEMCKLVENSFRDVNLAFANELSLICDSLKINVRELIDLANRHPRVNILQPGPGVGGHCIAIDPWFIVHQSPQESRLLQTAREVNDNKPMWVVEKVNRAIAEFLLVNSEKTKKDVTIACFGLTYKADIDDLRESPALKITKKIATTHPGRVIVVEPNIPFLPSGIASLVELNTVEQALSEAAIVIFLVDHKPFKTIPRHMYQELVVIDVCGLY